MEKNEITILINQDLKDKIVYKEFQNQFKNNLWELIYLDKDYNVLLYSNDNNRYIVFGDNQIELEKQIRNELLEKGNSTTFFDMAANNTTKLKYQASNL